MKRRDFIQFLTTAGVSSPFLIPSSCLGDDEKAAASERVNIGCIGVGGRGAQVFRMMLSCSNAQVVAVADCYKSRRESISRACGGKGFLDFREILEDPTIDAVTVCTPDHWHVPIALYAARAKKSCYVEKPLGLTLEQVLKCEKVFAENKVHFQYGTQQRSLSHCHAGCELVRKGRIGKVREIEVYSPNGGTGGNPTPCPIPENLGEDGYERWLGPAPKVPYCADRCRPQGTYWIYDQSIGYLGGWGAHPLDIMVWGSDADLSGLVTVEGTGKIGEPLYNTVYDWDMNIMLGDVKVKFVAANRDSTKFIGENGDWIDVFRGGLKASSPELIADPDLSDPVLTVSTHHAQNFVDAVRFDRTPVSCLKDAVRSDTISHLCDIAVRTKSKVVWDPAKRELVNPTPEQAAMVSRPIRAPWTL
ncbi:MAG: Gfo/Idh/MocA family oxidoreductase [Thermoguttaceae bacterium]|nr:Gfo/Idh/MocA family oxidoreductase [Thermoguttaceae bacterium]